MKGLLNSILEDLKEVRDAYRSGSYTELHIQNKTMIQTNNGKSNELIGGKVIAGWMSGSVLDNKSVVNELWEWFNIKNSGETRRHGNLRLSFFNESNHPLTRKILIFVPL